MPGNKPKQGGKRIFVSHKYARDHGWAVDLMNNARGKGYEAPPENWSLQEPVRLPDRAWEGEARKLIHQSQVIAVLLGRDTHTSQGVKREIEMAVEEGKQIIQIYSKKNKMPALRQISKKPRVPYDWEALRPYFDPNYRPKTQ